MKHLKRNLLAIVLSLVLVACVIATFLTRTSRPTAVPETAPATNAPRPVDDGLLQAARRLAAVAETTPEQTLSREALRLSDHEYDVAFATRLREAAAPTAPPTAELKKVVDRINQVKARIAANEKQIAKVNEEPATDENTARLALAKAQLALDQDELAEANEDLVRRGGDRHATLERMLQEHEAADHAAQQIKPSSPGRTDTGAEQFLVWMTLRDRRHQLTAADGQASLKASRLARGHDALEHLLRNETPSSDISPAILERLRNLSDQRKSLAELDKRIQDLQQLSDVYKRWGVMVEARTHDVLHRMLISASWMIAVLLVVVLVDRAIRYAFLRRQDRRRMHQLRVMATVAVQVVGALVILFIIFGPPTQISTMIGLTTAGLTVVLKDFIVAFFGWFALMGKNGIHLGDWVEIEGVGGEVIEIGILKTVLLEMGNWTNTGHPTGRRVAFVNKFAIENHYFNFSTAGQWLWDELRMTLPDTRDAYELATQIRAKVEEETATDGRLAEQDWERVTHQYGTRAFSARPAVDLQPSVSGLEVVVRYITRAPQRYEVKSRLLEAVVELVHKQAAANPTQVRA